MPRSLRDKLMNAQQAVASGFTARGVEVRWDAKDAPYADLKRRIMHLKPLPEELTKKDHEDVQGHVDHELGHLLFTDPKVTHADPLTKAVLNSIEDGRVEKEVAERWFGMGENLERSGKRALKELRKQAIEGDNMSIGVRTIVGLSLLAKGHKLKQVITSVGRDTEELFQYLQDCGALTDIDKLETTEDSARMAGVVAKRLREAKYDPPPPPPGPGDGEEGDGDSDGDEDSNGDNSKSKSKKKPKKDKSKDSKDEKKGKKPKKAEKNKGEEGEEGSEGSPEDAESNSGEGEGEDSKDSSKGEGEDSDDSGEGDEGEGSDSDGEGEDSDSDSDGEGEDGEGEGEEGEGEGEDSDSEGEGEGEGEGGDDGEGEGEESEGDGEGGGAGAGGDEGDEGEGQGDGAGDGSSDDYNNEEADGSTHTCENPIAGGYGAGASVNLAEAVNASGVAQIRKDMVAGKKFAYPDKYIVNEEYDKYEILDVKVDASEKKKFFDDLRSLVPLLRRKMQMEFQAPVRQFSRHQKKGKIDGRSLWKHGMGSERLFQRRVPKPEVHADLVLLIDISGSMSGEKVYLAAQSAAAFSQVLDLIGVRHEVLAFTTTGHPDAGDLYTRGFTRCEPVHHITVKPVNKTFHACEDNFVHVGMGHIGMCNNVDGEAVMWAARRLCEFQQDGAKKALVVFSDGYPAASVRSKSGSRWGSGDILRGHLKKSVKRIEEAGIPVAGVGILSGAVTHFYDRNVEVSDIDDLGGEFLRLIREILRENLVSR